MMSIMEVLLPAEPIVSGFAEPRLVSFADPEEPGYANVSRESKEIIHSERVRRIKDAMTQLGGKCLSSQIAEETGLLSPVVSRILQAMRREGLVSSQRIPGSTSRLWIRVEV